VLGRSTLRNKYWPAGQFGTGELNTEHVFLFSLTPKQAGAPTIRRHGQQLAPGWVAIASAQHSEI